MEFQIAERIMLLNLLGPIEGDITALRVVRSLQGQLGFDDEETAALEFRQPVVYVCVKCRKQYPEQDPAPETCPDCGGDLQGQPTGQIFWKGAAAVPKEIEISPAAQSIIVMQFEKVSSRKSLTLPQLALYERFVPEEETPPSE